MSELELKPRGLQVWGVGFEAKAERETLKSGLFKKAGGVKSYKT